MSVLQDVRNQLAALKGQVGDLGSTIAVEQAEINEALKRLQDLIEAGNVPQDVMDDLVAISASIQGAISNISNLVPTPTPLPEPPPAGPDYSQTFSADADTSDEHLKSLGFKMGDGLYEAALVGGTFRVFPAGEVVDSNWTLVRQIA